MKRRFNRPTCLMVSLIVVLSVLMLVPCGLVASVNLSEKDVIVIAPYFGLYVYKSSFQPLRLSNTTIIRFGDGGCSTSPDDTPQISIGVTVIAIINCDL